MHAFSPEIPSVPSTAASSLLYLGLSSFGSCRYSDTMVGGPVQSKRWSCSSLDEGIRHVLTEAKAEMCDDEEAALLREIEVRSQEYL